MDTVITGFIVVGIKGKSMMKNVADFIKNVKVIAICDGLSDIIESSVEAVLEITGSILTCVVSEKAKIDGVEISDANNMNH